MDKNKTKYIIGMIVAMLIWGVAWTSGKAAVEHSNAQVSSFWRYAISLIGMLPVIWYLKEPFKTDKVTFAALNYTYESKNCILCIGSIYFYLLC